MQLRLTVSKKMESREVGAIHGLSLRAYHQDRPTVCQSALGKDSFQEVNVMEYKLDRVIGGELPQGSSPCIHLPVHDQGYYLAMVGSEVEASPISSQSAVWCRKNPGAGDNKLQLAH